MSGILSRRLRLPGARSTARCPGHGRAPPRSGTGLSVPLHRALPCPRGLSSSLSPLPSSHLHLPTLPLFPAPCTLCSRGPWGAVLPREGALCCCSPSGTARTQFLKRPWALFLGRGLCPVLSLGRFAALTPPGQIPASPGICWGLIPFGDPYFPKLSMRKLHLLAGCWPGCPPLASSLGVARTGGSKLLYQCPFYVIPTAAAEVPCGSRSPGPAAQPPLHPAGVPEARAAGEGVHPPRVPPQDPAQGAGEEDAVQRPKHERLVTPCPTGGSVLSGGTGVPQALGTRVSKGPHPAGCCVPSGQGRCWKPSPADTSSLACFNQGLQKDRRE